MNFLQLLCLLKLSRTFSGFSTFSAFSNFLELSDTFSNFYQIVSAFSNFLELSRTFQNEGQDEVHPMDFLWFLHLLQLIMNPSNNDYWVPGGRDERGASPVACSPPERYWSAPPRNSEFLAFFPRFSGFPWGDFKPQKLPLLGSFKIHIFAKM